MEERTLEHDHEPGAAESSPERCAPERGGPERAEADRGSGARVASEGADSLWWLVAPLATRA
jgi:hypothetical protein